MQIFRNLALRYVRTKFKILSALSKKKAAREALDLFFTPPSRNKRVLAPIFSSGQAYTYTFQQYSISGYTWEANRPKKAVIIHGFESSIVNFHQYIKPLLDLDYGIIAFDAPAHGLSSGDRLHLLIYQDFILDLEKRFGPIEVYIGHSLGCLALCLALTQIDHTPDTKMVLLAAATETSTAIRQFFRMVGINDPVVREEFRKLIFEMSGHDSSWFSITRAIADIKARILWIHDETDRVTPLSDSLSIRSQNYPNLRFVITNGLGHSPIYRDEGVIAIVKQFLSS